MPLSNEQIEKNEKPDNSDACWKVIIADDDRMVQALTVLSLDKISFEGKPLELLHAYSGAETVELLKEHPDTALILLDVVMENEQAGLDAAKKIRTELNNQFVQIVLRTGQPGHAPQAKVIHEYEINGYLEKGMISNQGLQSSVIMSLRYYRNLMVIRNQHELMEKNLAEKKTLLKEVHHRVKNNLQILASMADLQNELSVKPESSSFLQQFRGRVYAMALVHELLYDHEDFAEILFGKYIEKISLALSKSYDIYSKVKINLKIDSDFFISLDIAIPCGLIINELITNSYQHAFPDSRGGDINIELEKKDKDVCLMIKDSGTGFSDGFNPEQSKRLGLLLVFQLVQQLDGTLDHKSEDGLEWIITFKLD